MNNNEITFLKDKDWRSIENEVCRVLAFTPLSGTIKNGHVEAFDKTTPYASVEFECPKINGKATGFITQKTDFAMLWAAFKEPGFSVPGVYLEIADTEKLDVKLFFAEGKKKMPEVWMVWTEKRYKRGVGLFKGALPKLVVMLCPKGAYELATDNSSQPELTGEARALAMIPMATWTPEVMER